MFRFVVFWLYSLLLFIFISGMSLHRSSTFCSHPFRPLVVNKSFKFKFKYQMTNHKKWSSYQTKTTLLLQYCCHKSTVVENSSSLGHSAWSSCDCISDSNKAMITEPIYMHSVLLLTNNPHTGRRGKYPLIGMFLFHSSRNIFQVRLAIMYTSWWTTQAWMSASFYILVVLRMTSLVLVKSA